MKKTLLPLFLLIATHVFSQIDKNGNPIFNSVTLREDTIKDFTLSSNYYTLKNNIENKNSFVYISSNPTLDEIENAARTLPSDFFLIMKQRTVLSIIMIRDAPIRQYFVITPASGKQKEFSCNISGDITENRANEILKEKYDSNTKIQGDKLFFNNKQLTIISTQEIKKGVLDLIEKQNLSFGDTGSMKILSKNELRNLIVTGSKEGGELDFFTEIKGHEYEGIQIKPGLFTTKLGIALYKWGRANFDLGVNKIEDALEFWEEFKGRKANQLEKSYIESGFNKTLEK